MASVIELVMIVILLKNSVEKNLKRHAALVLPGVVQAKCI